MGMLTLFADEDALRREVVDEVFRGLRGGAGPAFEAVLDVGFLKGYRTDVRQICLTHWTAT